MFILKGLLILFLFFFILGILVVFWLRYKFWQVKRNFRKAQEQNNQGTNTQYTKKEKPSKGKVERKGDYVDFEEVE